MALQKKSTLLLSPSSEPLRNKSKKPGRWRPKYHLRDQQCRPWRMWLTIPANKWLPKSNLGSSKATHPVADCVKSGQTSRCGGLAPRIPAAGRGQGAGQTWTLCRQAGSQAEGVPGLCKRSFFPSVTSSSARK